MKLLSSKAYNRAVEYLFRHGRALEQAVYNWHFAGGAANVVFEALGDYQNGDGGFGRALEPDIHAPESSVIATSFAFNLLREIGADARESLVTMGVKYLLGQYDSGLDRWPIVPAEVDQAPRAWWWDYAESAKTFNNFVYNPRLAVIGHLQVYSTIVPSEWLSKVRRQALADLRASSVEASMFDVLAGLGLLEAEGLPRPAVMQLKTWLESALGELLRKDPDRWGEYQLKPLDVVPSPAAPLRDAVRADLLDRHLDYVIESQLEDGSWPMEWSWEEHDPEAWAKSEKAWKGHEIVRFLKILKAHHRIEP